MKKTLLLPILSISLVLFADEEKLINALALPNGSYMLQTPPSYVATDIMANQIQSFTPEAMFDGNNIKGWKSKQYKTKGNTFIIELTETFIIQNLVFNNKLYRSSSSRCSREVEISFSTTSSAQGFGIIDTFELDKMQVQKFNLDSIPARWIKINILSNHGDQDFTELMELEANGYFQNPNPRPIDVSGTWKSNWGWVKLEADQSSVKGTYQYNKGTIPFGGIDRRIISYKWQEKMVNQEGRTILVVNDEGTRLTGIWCSGNNFDTYGFWILTRDSYSPPTPSEQEEEKINKEEDRKKVVEAMEKEIKNEGKLIVYGINFELDSDQIKQESHQVLHQIADLLNKQKDLNFRIEGHTDNVGSEEYNLELSERRAAHVKKYLVETHQVDESRISTIGKGESSPVASNDTELGRSSNRRVEIHPVQ